VLGDVVAGRERRDTHSVQSIVTRHSVAFAFDFDIGMMSGLYRGSWNWSVLPLPPFVYPLRADVNGCGDPTRTVDADGARVRHDWTFLLSTAWAVDVEDLAHTHRSVWSGKAALLSLNQRLAVVYRLLVKTEIAG
jgi:hypothetical protein